MNTAIKSIHGRQIYDSRGYPTLEVEIRLDDGSVGRAAIPAGASKGSKEAVELRDGDPKRFDGKGVTKAVRKLNEAVTPKLIGLDACAQASLDEYLITIDDTPNKSQLGANVILGVSLAAAKAAANSHGIPLYQHLGGVVGRILPVPLMNIFNGGRHADSSVDFQEFMIAPVGAKSFAEAMEMGTGVYHRLKDVLRHHGHPTAVGDEGGFAPNLRSNEEAIELIVEAIEKAGYKSGQAVSIALDPAASEFYQDGVYVLKGEGVRHTTDDLIDYYERLIGEYPILSIEDGLGEQDWVGFAKLNARLGKQVQIMGDDIFVTNPKLIARGIEEKTANSVLIKLNQIGTLTETIAAVETAMQAGWTAVISHRSGETDDSTIADFAVAMNTGQIKAGAPARGERLAKYNQLLRIEEELGHGAIYAGASAFPQYKE